MKFIKLIELLLVLSILMSCRAQQQTDCNHPPAVSIHPSQCCMIPEFFNDIDLVNCRRVEGSEGLGRPTRKKRFATSRLDLGTCYLDCVFNVTGIRIGANIDVVKLTQTLTQRILNHVDSVTVITSAVNGCISDFQTGVLRLQGQSNNCSPVASALVMCIQKKFFFSCPPNRWFASNDCFILRDFLFKCPSPI